MARKSTPVDPKVAAAAAVAALAEAVIASLKDEDEPETEE